MALIGPNGVGKSTLLSLAAGDLTPHNGAITFHGRALQDWRYMDLAQHRAVFTQQQNAKLNFTVQEIIELGRFPYRAVESNEEQYFWIRKAIVTAHIEHLTSRVYSELSGGEQQRVNFVRIFSQILGPDESLKHKILLLDEPLNNLDLPNQAAILRGIKHLAELGVSVLIIMHDLNLAFSLTNDILLLGRNGVVVTGTPKEILSTQEMPRLFGDFNFYHLTEGKIMVLPHF